MKNGRRKKEEERKFSSMTNENYKLKANRSVSIFSFPLFSSVLSFDDQCFSLSLFLLIVVPLHVAYFFLYIYSLFALLNSKKKKKMHWTRFSSIRNPIKWNVFLFFFFKCKHKLMKLCDRRVVIGFFLLCFQFENKHYFFLYFLFFLLILPEIN